MAANEQGGAALRTADLPGAAATTTDATPDAANSTTDAATASDSADDASALVDALVDASVDALVDASVDALVAQLLASTPASSRLVLRGGACLVPRLRAVDVAPQRWRTAGSHVVTGGLGAIGRPLAAWLLEQGAEQVLLVGRAAPSAEHQRWLEEGRGRLRYLQGDLGQESTVQAALALVETSGLALRGVFHAAGVLDDGPIEGQTWARAERVLHAKVRGATLLDRMTRGHDLDAFVMFSSVASILGTPGQASYAAANAYLDALATSRRAQGLPAISVAWGPWRGEGMAARTRSQDRWQALGVQPIAPRAAFALLGALLARAAAAGAQSDSAAKDEASTAAWVVFPVRDRQALRRFLPACPLWNGELASGAAPEASASHGELRRKLALLPAAARQPAVQDFVLAEVWRQLGESGVARLDPQRPLSESGFDSLMAVRLRDVLQTALDVTLSATASFDHPTPAALARHLVDRLGFEDLATATLAQAARVTAALEPAQPSTALSSEAVGPPAAELTADVDEMSADELLQFLDSRSHGDDEQDEAKGA